MTRVAGLLSVPAIHTPATHQPGDTPAALLAPLAAPRCQLGAQKLRAALPDYWPDDADEPRKPLQGLQICPGTDFKVGN